MTAEVIDNLGAITVVRDLVVDAATITSPGDITLSGFFGTVTVHHTGGATGPDVTVSGSIDHADASAWEQSGGSLDLTESTLDGGDYTLTSVDVVIAHDMVGDAVPTLRVIDGDVDLDPTAPAVDVELVGASILTGGGVGTAQTVAIENVGGASVTTVTVPGDLVNDGTIRLHRSGTGGGESHLVVADTFTNAGTLITTSGSDRMYSVTAELIDSPGAMHVARDLTLDAATITSSGEVTFSSFNALLMRDTGGSTGPDVTLSGSIDMESFQRYDQVGGTLAVGDGVVIGGGLVRITDVAVQAAGALDGRLELLGSSVLAPGSSPGVLDLTGAYQQGLDAALDVELGGTVAGSGYDQVNAGGAATLGGTLALSLIDGFTPAPCDTFDVLTAPSRSGTFATVTGRSLDGGLELVAAYRSTGLRLIAGTTEDDAQAFPTVIEVTRAAPSQTYAICLTRQPTADVTITPSVVGDAPSTRPR